MFLKPGTKYEVRLDLADPDGGTAAKTVNVATRPIPELPKGGRTLHVVPGSGGGSGSADDPFRGLAAAQDAAEPGDVLLLHKGDYGDFVFQKLGDPGKYIAYKAAGDGDAVFTSMRVGASHLWLEGLTFKRRDESNGLRAQGQTADVVIRRNTFTGFHYSITLSTQSRNWDITDNVIVGDNDPNQPTTQGGISGEGVELNHSGGHVVAYNSISRVADGVSYPERNVDIYGNDIFDVSDDGLEPDRGYANVRMWGNRITNAKNNALSFQPMRCGPWYFVRNLVIGQGAVFKFRGQDRFVLVNNTFVRCGATGNRMHHILTSFSRNNRRAAQGQIPRDFHQRDHHSQPERHERAVEGTYCPPRRPRGPRGPRILRACPGQVGIPETRQDTGSGPTPLLVLRVATLRALRRGHAGQQGPQRAGVRMRRLPPPRQVVLLVQHSARATASCGHRRQDPERVPLARKTRSSEGGDPGAVGGGIQPGRTSRRRADAPAVDEA